MAGNPCGRLYGAEQTALDRACELALQVTSRVLMEAGLLLTADKSILAPTQVVEFLRVLANFREGTVCIPPYKRLFAYANPEPTSFGRVPYKDKSHLQRQKPSQKDCTIYCTISTISNCSIFFRLHTHAGTQSPHSGKKKKTPQQIWRLGGRKASENVLAERTPAPAARAVRARCKLWVYPGALPVIIATIKRPPGKNKTTQKPLGSIDNHMKNPRNKGGVLATQVCRGCIGCLGGTFGIIIRKKP